MKIHSDVLTARDIYQATAAAGMRGVDAEVTTHGSRSRARSFNVHLTGTSTRRTNPGWAYGERDFAATWDEWGMFINALYEIDPEAIIGQYPSKAVFEYVTNWRFEHLTAPYQHGEGGHRWKVEVPGVQECTSCSATFRWMELHTLAREIKKGNRPVVPTSR